MRDKRKKYKTFSDRKTYRRETETAVTERQTDIQTDRDRQTYRQIERDRQTYRQIETDSSDRKTDRQTV